MPVVIALAGFLGAWLLVAGPVYQAAQELDAEEVDRAGISAAASSLPQPRPMSPWWWLLPPLAVIRSNRARHRHQAALYRAMTPQQVQQAVRFTAKAAGWLFVAGGAALIAVKETWELVEVLHQEAWLFWLLLLVALVLSFLNAALRMRRDHVIVATRSREAAAG